MLLERWHERSLMDDDDAMGGRIDRRLQPTFANRQQEDVTLQRVCNNEARIMICRECYVDSQIADLLSTRITTNVSKA